MLFTKIFRGVFAALNFRKTTHIPADHPPTAAALTKLYFLTARTIGAAAVVFQQAHLRHNASPSVMTAVQAQVAHVHWRRLEAHKQLGKLLVGAGVIDGRMAGWVLKEVARGGGMGLWQAVLAGREAGEWLEEEVSRAGQFMGFMEDEARRAREQWGLRL